MILSTNNACTVFTLVYSEIYYEEGVTVPAGFAFDGASVPRILWWWLPPIGRYLHAAVLHDYLYRKRFYSRAHADLSFRRQMARDGVGWRTRWTMYLAVRAFGWSSWR